MEITTKIAAYAMLSMSLFGSNAAVNIENEPQMCEAQTLQEVVEPVVVENPRDAIVKYANEFGVSPDLMLKIAECESGFNPDARGDNKGGEYLAVGLFQYHAGMWSTAVELYKKEIADEEFDRYNYSHQAKLTAFVFSHHPELRSRWTSYVAYTNGGIYSFYSTLLGKHFDVICK